MNNMKFYKNGKVVIIRLPKNNNLTIGPTSASVKNSMIRRGFTPCGQRQVHDLAKVVYYTSSHRRARSQTFDRFASKGYA